MAFALFPTGFLVFIEIFQSDIGLIIIPIFHLIILTLIGFLIGKAIGKKKEK